ncbi:MAG: hypothetical protein K8R25_02955 [Methanosarcinales archaeon]|nr:hypothetical protein [Methanosarcinales archaeon]
MNKTKNERIKEAIKTPLGTTILVTIVIVILLFVLIDIKNKILIAETIDASIIFLAILPFLIYLIISDKISEMGGGGFAIRFYKASEEKVLFGEDEVPYFDEEAIVKWNRENLKNCILPEFVENPRSTLKMKKEYIGHYKYNASKEYLEELTKFDFFRYVLFEENEVFNGYILARTLLAQLMSAEQGYLFRWDKIPGNDDRRLIEFLIMKFGIDWVKTAKIGKIDGGNTIRLTNEINVLLIRLNDEKTKANLEIDDGRTDEFIVKTENCKQSIYERNWIIDNINEWNLDEIPGCKKDYVFNYWSSKEVLRIMEERGITDIAVVDKDMKFKGFTNREMIIARIVNKLIIKAE